MPNENPYSPPQTDVEVVQAEPVGEFGLWRQRDLLVASYGANFPDRCPITNRPATTRYAYEFSSLPTILKIILFFGIGIWLTLLADATSTKLRLRIPLDDEWVGLSRIQMAIACIFAMVGCSLVALGLFIDSVAHAAGFLIGLGIVLLAACGIWSLFFRQDLSASNVTASHVWISGVHPDFLAVLPEWSRERP